ncbi:hypothetical protein TRFO_34536 [Tritrichomonas foetus]|uniref:Translation initiation factor eIF2B subunit gamma n=1 Tax=Tritrichomonas foetus TaxID=1144522 RepID=A0A1J4JKI0_9EUKA|nr:hypothetical protein TRFO_34536 [Tritrichomonas foetus]|eukprot:OHS99129.1 hypothetical protein TRFO_34536 [Tritrichomonas foetus]
MKSEKKIPRSPYSNIQIVIMANRPAFTRETFGESQLFGLLPIANKPILGHLLDQFERYGFNNIALVCLRKDETAYAEFLLQYTSNPVRLIPVEGVMTTCEIIRNKISTENHLFLFPIDLLTSQNLTSIIDFHISTQSLITIVTSKFTIDEKERRNAPGFQPLNMSSIMGQRYFVYDESNPTKLVTLLSDSLAMNDDLDLSLKQVTMNDQLNHEDSSDSLASSDGGDPDDGMNIRPEFLNGFHSLSVDCSQRLTSAFLFSPACISKLRELPDIHSIESELIPTLCREAVEINGLVNEGESPTTKHIPASIFCTGKDEFAYRVIDYATLYITNMKCALTKLVGFSPSADFTQVNGANNGYFTEGKHRVHNSFNYLPFSVYGDNLVVTGEDVNIQRSVIGRHCKIGKNVKIFNSILFDHVTVDEGVLIRDCIIGADSVIHSNSEFKQCIIVPRYASDKAVSKEKCIVQMGEK